MTKIFKKTPAKDMTKDDAANAAQLLENVVSVIEMLNEVIVIGIALSDYCL